MRLPLHSERQVIRLSRKKILFVIVEGPSDETALGVLFNRLFDRNSVYVHIWHGDVTSDMKSAPSNIVSKVGNAVKSYANSHHYGKKDFSEIIHIIDTDGVFIPEDHVIEDLSLTGHLYSEASILTPYRERILERNRLKKSNIERLLSCKAIWSIPYSLYYMSSNLEHVLYDVLNCTDEEKENYAYQFAKKYQNDIVGFLHYIAESDFSVMDGYKESWMFIQQKLHSLERHTNLGLKLPPPPHNTAL